VEQLLLGHTNADPVRRLGWDQVTFLRKATGRAPINQTEQARVSQAGIRWLTSG
jgi:hypothetical protein